jgi:hypothetical protein
MGESDRCVVIGEHAEEVVLGPGRSEHCGRTCCVSTPPAGRNTADDRRTAGLSGGVDEVPTAGRHRRVHQQRRKRSPTGEPGAHLLGRPADDEFDW